jgi:hypothetical protein
MMNNLGKKDLLANLTMNKFEINVRDCIMWWRVYGYAVSDTISNQRSQVNQAVKAQILSKWIVMHVICVNINSPFLYNGIVKNLIDMKV